jgi:hypothetical protein
MGLDWKQSPNNTSAESKAGMSVRAAQVLTEMGRMEDSLDIFDKVLSELRQRLDVVLFVDSKAGEEEAEKELEQAPLAMRIRIQRNRLDAMIERVKIIMEHLQI